MLRVCPPDKDGFMLQSSEGSGAPGAQAAPSQGRMFAALDLGTNNCRLLVAAAHFSAEGTPVLKVCDSFSRSNT